LESLILLYQLYAMVSMFLYQYIISKSCTVQKNQALKSHLFFPSIQLLPAIISKSVV